jgi:hypothetical protein
LFEDELDEEDVNAAGSATSSKIFDPTDSGNITDTDTDSEGRSSTTNNNTQYTSIVASSINNNNKLEKNVSIAHATPQQSSSGSHKKHRGRHRRHQIASGFSLKDQFSGLMMKTARVQLAEKKTNVCQITTPFLFMALLYLSQLLINNLTGKYKGK